MFPESVFTEPRLDCPHPEYWSSTDSDSTEVEVTELVGAFVRALQPELVVETGTAFGQTAEAIGRALKTNGHGRLVSFEVDPERVRLSRERCAGLPVEIREQSSLDWLPDGPVDFAWFDSLAHLRPEEFKRYHLWMHERTVVGFHDTGPQHPVRGLLDDMVASGDMPQPLYLPTPRGVCFVRVWPGV